MKVIILSIHFEGMGMAYAYGWGSTGPTGPAVGNVCPKDFPNILQETELTICTAAESEAYPWPNNQGQGLVDGQLCAVGATSTTYSVNINNQHYYEATAQI